MHKALSIALACCSLGSQAQGFNKRIDAFGQGFEQGAFGIELTDSGYMIFSASYEPDTIAPDSLITITSIIQEWIDEVGSLQSERRHKVSEQAMYPGWADCCDTVLSGGAVSAGGIENFAGEIRVRLMRYGPEGDTLWTKEFGSDQHYWIGQQVKRLSDNGFIICGGTDATGYQDGFLIRTDADGNELWRQTYGWSNPVYVDGLTAVVEAVNGDLFMSGSRFLSLYNGQHWVQRTGADGTLEWRVSWGGDFTEGALYISALADGNLIAASGNAYADEILRPYLAKLDTADGSRLWEHEYGPVVYSTLFFAAKECPNTDIIACGVTYVGGYEKGLLAKVSTTGDSLWMRYYTNYFDAIDSCRGRFYDVLTTDDGGFIAAGFANAPSSGPFPVNYSQDTWVLKVDSMGCVVPGCDGTGVESIVTNLQGALTLAPNPAHGQVQVHVALPPSLRNKPDLKLTLVNAAGQVALVQVAREGDNTVPLGAFSSGVYYVHLSSYATWLSGTKLVVE